MPPAESQSREIAEASLRDSVDAIAAFDRERRLAAWNPAMEAFTGIPSSAVLGRSIAELAPPLRELVDRWPLERVLAGETVVSEDQLHVQPDGARRYCDWRYSPVRDGGGAPIFGLAVARDTTTRHEVERRAAELDAVFRALND